MKEQLVALVRLQHLDERIRNQAKRLASIPDELGEREAAYSAREAAAEQLEAERKSCLARAQDLENDVAKHETRITKLEEQIHGARDAGAVSVARHEADALRGKVAAAQEEALQLLEEADRYAAERDEARAAVAEQRSELEHFREVVVEDQSSIGAVLEDLEAQRRVLVEPLPPVAQQTYARVADARKGRAVVAMRGTSCAGCGSSLPPNEQVRIAAGNSLQTCRSCGRILVPLELWSAGSEES